MKIESSPENKIKEILYEYQEKTNKKLAEIQNDFFIKTLKFAGCKKEINERDAHREPR